MRGKVDFGRKLGTPSGKHIKKSNYSFQNVFRLRCLSSLGPVSSFTKQTSSIIKSKYKLTSNMYKSKQKQSNKKKKSHNKHISIHDTNSGYTVS
jgi:hypothetical protein